jgi:hypothetical protein
MTDIVHLQAYDWLQLLGLGGFIGALGQGVRTIVGLKKLNDAASGSSLSIGDMIAPARLFVSLAVGFIAGALAAVGLIKNLADISSEQIFALAAAGYAGADFIEGFVSRTSATTQAPAGQEAVGVGVGGAGAAAATATSAATSADDAVG